MLTLQLVVQGVQLRLQKDLIGALFVRKYRNLVPNLIINPVPALRSLIFGWRINSFACWHVASSGSILHSTYLHGSYLLYVCQNTTLHPWPICKVNGFRPCRALFFCTEDTSNSLTCIYIYIWALLCQIIFSEKRGRPSIQSVPYIYVYIYVVIQRF